MEPGKKYPIKECHFVNTIMLWGQPKNLWNEVVVPTSKMRFELDEMVFILTHPDKSKPELRIPLHYVKQYQVDYSKVDLRKNK